MMSFHEGPLVVCYASVMPCVEKFFHMFLYFISSSANVGKLYIVICSLLVGVDFVANELKLE